MAEVLDILENTVVSKESKEAFGIIRGRPGSRPLTGQIFHIRCPHDSPLCPGVTAE